MTPRMIERKGLSTTWERRVARTAIAVSVAALVVAGVVGVGLSWGVAPLWASIPLALAVPWLIYFFMTRRVRRRRAILAEPFPTEWEAVLQREVVFFRALPPEQQRRFRRELQVFLGEKRITGIKIELDATTRVLAGASAIIPIFGFPEWEWDQISEVLIYPDRFDEEFAFQDGDGRQTLGMVGTGALDRLMILSKPDLLAGFRNPGDKRNVGIHEFAHLVDKSDGLIDGLPDVGLDRGAVGPWVELVRRKMAEIDRGDSDIDRYALTNPAEFFAVSTEYFFERPGVMKRKHPELYSRLAGVFQQNMADKAAELTREIRLGRPRFGRNSPCPCGSGIKYKKCCLGAAKRT